MKNKFLEKFFKPDFRVYVFGLPRSGTSCMTHICELLGVKMVHTSEEKPHEYPHLGEYHPNPTGFYEVTNNLFMHYMEIYNTPYSGCKMIVPVNGFRWDVVKSAPAKVILMVRDTKEIKESQEAFYSKESDEAYLRTALVSQRLWLKESGIEFIEVEYRNLIFQANNEIWKVYEFIKSKATNKDVQRCLDFIRPSLYRQQNGVPLDQVKPI